MLTLQKSNSAQILAVPLSDRPVEDLLTKEWLLTNNRGGYSSSTVVGCNTRRYHGLLIGTLSPMANRIMALANCLETVIIEGNVFNLSTFEFDGKFAPEGFRYLKQFRRDIGVHFDYRLGGLEQRPGRLPKRGRMCFGRPTGKSCRGMPLELTKSVYLLRDTDTVAVVYDFPNIQDFASQGNPGADSVESTVEFVLRPFIGLRDFHSLQKSYAPLVSTPVDGGLLVRHDVPHSCELYLGCPSMDFRTDQQWWFHFVYRHDKKRGQDFAEDLWSPGFFKCRLDSAARIVLWAGLNAPSFEKHHEGRAAAAQAPLQEWMDADIDAVRKDLYSYQQSLRHSAASVKLAMPEAVPDARYEALCSAAGQFVAARRVNGKTRTTILAGFPWFCDWGRDAFVSLPGLLLLTGRFEEAKSVLITFAQAADAGMIPSRFDDYSNTAHFNSIDASLWFINAGFQYLNTTGDSETFTKELLPAIRWIVDSYQKGTRFGIHADSDGLITGGSDETQLTWMDAKYGGVAFTSRYGKAVEVNALWYNSLCQLAQFYGGRDTDAAGQYAALADQVGASFCSLFWNEELGRLNDCILPDGSPDSSLRPNQIFAVSLAFSPLSGKQQKAVVNAVKKKLLTPYGLRTLNVEDSRYKGQYAGHQGQRDEAYHQGTVWPYLMGAFVEAYLKVNGAGRKSKKKAAEFIQPLMRHLTDDGCIGQVSEIFDGDAPHTPRGCFAQAWSVAELIRAHRLVNS
ncbi:MAG: amylo-alpha-1,6-glucosidase [Planctomycetota bacterium]